MTTEYKAKEIAIEIQKEANNLYGTEDFQEFSLADLKSAAIRMAEWK